MKVSVNQEMCIGCSVCVDRCPEVFVLSDNPWAEVIVQRVAAEQKDACRVAAADCPVEAITLEE